MEFKKQGKLNKVRNSLLVCASSVAILAGSAMADDSLYSFNVDPQTLETALMDVARQSGIQLMFETGSSALLPVDAIKGRMNIEAALAQLLSKTNLRFTRKKSGIYVIAEQSGFQKISYNSSSDYEAKLGVYEGDERVDGVNAFELDEIIVTASRREQNLQDVPMSVAVVQPEEFTAVGLGRLSDIIAYTPGVSVSNVSGEPSGANITARGAGAIGRFSFNAATVGVYLDAVPLTSNSPWGLGDDFAFDGMLGDVERVEFLKGPQGTLYGSTSIGGALKYITRKPSLDEFRAHASVDISGTKEGGFNQTYNGRISTPIIEDKLGFSIAGFYEDNGGYMNRVDPVSGELMDEDADAYDRYGFSGDLYFRVNDKLSLRGRVLYQEATYSGLSLVDFDPENKEPLFGRYDVSLSRSDREMRNVFYAGTIEYEFDGATLTSTTSYVDGDYAINGDLILPAFAETVDLFAGRPIGTTTNFLSTVGIGGEKFTQEIQLASDAGERWDWILGLYYADEETTATNSFIAMPGDVILSSSSSPSEYREYAAFGNLIYHMSDRLDITLGARLSDSKMVFTNLAEASVFSPADEFNSNVKDTVNTWSFALSYRPHDGLSLYARAANGYRPASANQLVIDFNGVDRLPRFIESDTLWSYEFGAKGSALERLISYDVALWYTDWNNFQAAVTLPDGFNGGLSNVDGGITAKGVEGTVTVKPVGGLSIISNFAYTKSTLNADEPRLNGEKGQQLPFIPEWTFSSRARYDFALTGAIDAYVGVGVRYESSSRSEFTDADGGSVNIPTDSYVLVDMNAGMQLGHYALSLYATNLLNEYALTNTNGIANRGVPLRPRTIGVRLSVDF